MTGLTPTHEVPERKGSTGFGLPLAIGLAVVMLLLGGLTYLSYLARSEAREAFFEQYNRQQLAVAQEAAGKIQELFLKFRNDLSLAARLLGPLRIDIKHTAEIGRELDKVYQGIAGETMVEFVVFDRLGTAVGITPMDIPTIGSDYSWREYYKWARDIAKPGDLYLSPFMALKGGKGRGHKGLILAQALYDEEAIFTGVAALVINFDEVAKSHVKTVRLGENGHVWLLDNSNRQMIFDQDRGVTDISFEEAMLPRWKALYALAQKSNDGIPGTGSYEYTDPKDPKRTSIRLVAHAPIKIGSRLWTLGVNTPAADAEVLIVNLIERQSELSLAAILLTIIGAASGLTLLFNWNRLLKKEVESRTKALEARTSDLDKANRTLESTFEELLAARKLAALGNLAAGLAHEIRNPLFSIGMNVQMIRRKTQPEPAIGESFDIVEKEIHRLNRLLGDVLGFARPVKLNQTTENGATLADDVLKLVAERLGDLKIEVTADLDEETTLRCDREKLAQLLLNIILNAAESLEKISPPRKLWVTVRKSPIDNFIEFIVADNGPGLPQGDYAKLFDPFFTTKASGGGLGLSIAQSIAVAHSGSLEASENPGGGAVFTLKLPQNPVNPSEVTPL